MPDSSFDFFQTRLHIDSICNPIFFIHIRFVISIWLLLIYEASFPCGNPSSIIWKWSNVKLCYQYSERKLHFAFINFLVHFQEILIEAMSDFRVKVINE